MEKQNKAGYLFVVLITLLIQCISCTSNTKTERLYVARIIDIDTVDGKCLYFTNSIVGILNSTMDSIRPFTYKDALEGYMPNQMIIGEIGEHKLYSGVLVKRVHSTSDLAEIFNQNVNYDR
jgi:hypothetical protein